MKQLMIRSMKINAISTVASILICVGLIISNVYQVYHCKKIVEKQGEVFQEALDEQIDKYLDLIKIEQPAKSPNFLKKGMGKFALSWYSPKELGKPLEKLRTSRGNIPKEGRTIAVDPKVIPYGSVVYIEGYGYYIAEDTGGTIKGNRIDIFTEDYNKAIQLGRKTANAWIIGKK